MFSSSEFNAINNWIGFTTVVLLLFSLCHIPFLFFCSSFTILFCVKYFRVYHCNSFIDFLRYILNYFLKGFSVDYLIQLNVSQPTSNNANLILVKYKNFLLCCCIPTLLLCGIFSICITSLYIISPTIQFHNYYFIQLCLEAREVKWKVYLYHLYN